MGSPDYISYGFALIVFSGGLIGYAKAGSVPSLASGVAFAGLLAYGAYRTSTDPKDFFFLLAVSGILLGVMGYRFFLSGKFMPAGLVASLSLLQVGRLAFRLAA